MDEQIKDTENIADVTSVEGSESGKKKKIDAKYLKIGAVAFGVIVCTIIFYFALFDNDTLFVFFKKVLDTLEPFAIGAILAYLLKPICVKFENLTEKWFGKMKNRQKAKKLCTNISITFTMITFLVFLYILLAAVIPQVVDSIKILINSAPTMLSNTMNWLKGFVKGNVEMEQQIDNFSVGAMDLMNKAFEKMTSNDYFEIISRVTTGVKGVIKLLTNVLVGIIACIYILAQRKKFAKQGTMLVHSIFPPKWAEKVMDEVAYIDRMFSGFINGKIIDSIIIGFLTFIILTIFRVPYAMLVSVIVGITNIIPFFGPFIGAIPSALIVLMVDPLKGLYFIIIIIVIQQLDGNVIGPKILGNTTGLSSFWVLFSIILFGGLYGFMGMLVGVPLFAVLYDIVRRLIRHGLVKWKKEDMFTEYKKEQEEESVKITKKTGKKGIVKDKNDRKNN